MSSVTRSATTSGEVPLSALSALSAPAPRAISTAPPLTEVFENLENTVPSVLAVVEFILSLRGVAIAEHVGGLGPGELGNLLRDAVEQEWADTACTLESPFVTNRRGGWYVQPKQIKSVELEDLWRRFNRMGEGTTANTNAANYRSQLEAAVDRGRASLLQRLNSTGLLTPGFLQNVLSTNQLKRSGQLRQRG